MGNFIIVELLEGDRILDKHSYFDQNENKVARLTPTRNKTNLPPIETNTDSEQTKEAEDEDKEIGELRIHEPKASHNKTQSRSLSTPSTPGSTYSMESNELFTDRWGDDAQGFHWNEDNVDGEPTA